MQLEKIKLKNIRSFVDGEIDFPSGTTLLAGEIGTGKTSVLLAIDFVLFGIRRGTGTGLLRNGEDNGFFVFVDGQQIDFVPEPTAAGRNLEIPFPEGTQEIQIIGTEVIPEFGTIATLILGAAIVSIIAVTSRSRLSVTPKF